MPSHRKRHLVVHVDLTGNTKLGPDWLEADVEITPPADWDNERIRRGAAEHYGVPLSQVDDPYPKTWEDVDVDEWFGDGPYHPARTSGMA